MAAPRPDPGRNSAFVDRFQDYGGHQVQRFLDLDWVKIVHTVTGNIFPQWGSRGALHEIERPALPLSYGRAKEHLMREYGQVTEGRGQESLGSTLADYIWTEISLRAETCTNPIHYKAIGNNLWYTLGAFVEPPPRNLPGIPPKNAARTNEVGNVYEALVGLYWLEENYDGLTDLFLTLMDLGQIEYS